MGDRVNDEGCRMGLERFAKIQPWSKDRDNCDEEIKTIRFLAANLRSGVIC
jgi:hypothetical protein